MSKGDEYAKAMPDILTCMYEAGAIATKRTLDVDAVAKEVALEPKEAQAVMILLEEQGKVTRVAGKSYRLTGPGFEEAEQLARRRKGRWVRPAVE